MGDAGSGDEPLAVAVFPDTPVTIDDADIGSLEHAVDGLLDKAQENLGFPYSTDPKPPSPSKILTYRLNAAFEVALDTQWPLFEGLTLTNITLRVAVDKFKGSAGL